MLPSRAWLVKIALFLTGRRRETGSLPASYLLYELHYSHPAWIGDRAGLRAL